MSATDTINSASSNAGTASTSSSSSSSGLAGLTADNFLQMLITQLQNQDPLNPTNSDQILQQISEIRNIQATSDLTTSLGAVASDQSFQTASGLIGKQVQGVDTSGNPVSGTVDSASFSKGTATLNVGSQILPLAGISSISDPSSANNGTNVGNLLNSLNGG